MNKRFVFTLLIYMLLLISCSKQTYNIAGGTIKNDSNKISASYNQLNGYINKEISFNVGDKVTFTSDISTVSGSINIILLDKDNDIVFSMNESTTKNLDIEFSSPFREKYTLQINANEHEGSFLVKWQSGK